MPPKKKRAAEDEVDYEEALTKNYKKACKLMGLAESRELLALLVPPDEATDGIQQLVCDAAIGSGGCRALAAALLGRGVGMLPVPYKPIKSLRMWRNEAGDAGAAAVAQVIKHGLDAVALTHVEIMDNAVGKDGCWALGDALMLGANASLLTLRLDINPSISDEGCIELCKGLRTNRTLTRLSLSYCNIGPIGASALAEVLASPLCVLQSVDLSGNAIGSEGLAAIARAVRANTKLEELVVSDNSVGASTDEEVNAAAMQALGQALSAETSALARVNLEMNSLVPEDAALLVPFLADNPKVKSFKVDATLPVGVYDALLRVDSGGKKKGKKGKKGKKKK